MNGESPHMGGSRPEHGLNVRASAYSTNALIAEMGSAKWVPASDSIGELLSRQAGSLGLAMVRRFAKTMLAAEGSWWLRLNDTPDDLEPGDMAWIVASWDQSVTVLVGSWGVAA